FSLQRVCDVLATSLVGLVTFEVVPRIEPGCTSTEEVADSFEAEILQDFGCFVRDRVLTVLTVDNDVVLPEELGFLLSGNVAERVEGDVDRVRHMPFFELVLVAHIDKPNILVLESVLQLSARNQSSHTSIPCSRSLPLTDAKGGSRTPTPLAGTGT